MQQEHSINQSKQAKYIGILLAALSLISIFAMLHHPSISATNVHAQIEEINQESPINALVHGGLIALTVLISFCLTYYARHRGFNRVSILFGLLCYWLGTLAMINAALISGFIVPQLAENYSQANAAQLDVFAALRKLSWVTNQTFANFGAICWCIAICCWAFDMFKQGKVIKLFAVISSISALTIALSLLTAWLSLGVNGMTLVLIVVSAWQLGIAWLLIAKQ